MHYCLEVKASANLGTERCSSVAARPLIICTSVSDCQASLKSAATVQIALTKASRNFRWRCVLGKHPYPSRTRRLRPGRPKVLYWQRYGRIGGCRIKKESKGSDIDHRMESLPSVDDCLSSQKAKQISSISTKHLLLERKNLIHCTLKTEY